MGAGGSTAASCSSLDLANHRRHQQQQQHLHEQRMQKYRKQQNAKVLPTPAPKIGKNSSYLLKHSSSNFDLTQNHLLHHQPSFNEGQQQAPMNNLVGTTWLDGPGPTEAYSISNANYKAARPLVILPNNNKPVSPVHLLNGAKRSNAGVANRIHQHHQRQLNRGNELRRFSDSLPSLNNLIDPQQQQPDDVLVSPISSYANSPPSHCRQQKQNLLMNHKSAKSNQIKQQKHLIMHCHSGSGGGSRNSNHPNTNLVNRYDDFSNQHWPASGGQQQLMKRATSLSSLHNSHNHHQPHKNHYASRRPQQQPQQRSTYYLDGSFSNQQSSSNHNAPQTHANNNSSYESSDLAYDLARSRNRNSNGFMNQQQPIQYNQSTPLAKKILKFKQVSGNGSPSSKSSRYKQKQKTQQQQQQQGCPVLPPLPRSQSLHELIQLRATENGQRMRTTGTLRGPLGATDTSNKVNLVVELLENRRQQKMTEQQNDQQVQEQNLNSETMLSQADSSDDGIHDISLTADQSTESRHQESNNSPDNDVDSYDRNHRLSVNSERGVNERTEKHRVFNKSHHSSNINQKRYNNRQNQPQQERPLSQKVNVAQKDEFQSQASKSTLKRSVSHSALHDSLHNLDISNNDEDESDDLNELAKFLYQFKQRQASKNAAGIARSTNESSVKLKSSPNEQQSPNSTTSSSGFASSTCTTNSISSSDELGHKVKPKSGKAKKSEGAQVLKQSNCRKKYPAPQRPDEQNANISKDKKNPISGQLKLSSSLLSIVDEYNSTLQSKEKVAPAINKNSSAKLTSVLLGEVNNLQVEKNSIAKVDHTKGYDNESSSNVAQVQQQHQLEQLRRYTQLRQMSQSELALNHLTSSGNSKVHFPAAKDKREHRAQRNSKPYKSKLINIIRRISDKSESADVDSNSKTINDTTAMPSVAIGGLTANQATGSKEKGVINQNEMSAFYLDQSRQEYNHGKFSKIPNDKACLSESLCDLNFDCDFELIKNLNSSNVEQKGAASALQRLNDCSLLETDPHQPRGVADPSSKAIGKKHYQQIINSSKSENNWRLVPSSLSLDKSTAYGSENEFHQQQLRLQARQSMGLGAGNIDRSKCKLLVPPTNKLASQAKLKWSASDWHTNSSNGSSAEGNEGSKERTKGKKLLQHHQASESCLSKSSILNNGIPLSIATSNNEILTKGDALIESKSFAKVNSEAKQLLNELDHSLDMVSGRYPFSRKAALSWWKVGDDLVSGTNDQLAVDAERLAYQYEFPSSSNSDLDDDDYDNDDYACINRAMINATFDVDVNQTKHLICDNPMLLPLDPGSPSDSFTFSASNSPVVPLKGTNATKLLSSPTKSEQSKGENHMSKQHSMDKTTKQQPTYSHVRDSFQQTGSGCELITAVTAQEMITSQSEGGSGIKDRSNQSKLAPEAVKSKFADKGFAGNKRIASYGDGIEDTGGNIELGREDGKIRSRRIDTVFDGKAPEANNQARDSSVSDTYNKLAGSAGIGMNRDLYAHEHEVGNTKQHCSTVDELSTTNASNAKNNNHNHNGFRELVKTRCPMSGSRLGNDSHPTTEKRSNKDRSDDISNDHHRTNGQSRQLGHEGSNSMLPEYQYNCYQKDSPTSTPNQYSSKQQSSLSNVCQRGNSPATNDRGKEGSSCRSCCHKHQGGGAGVKSGSSTNGLLAQKLDGSACCFLQGQQKCEPGQLPSAWCYNPLNENTNALMDNENLAINSLKQAVKCSRQSSPKEQLNSNGRQIVENKLSEMRSCNCSGVGCAKDGGGCNNMGDTRASKCCFSASNNNGCGENIFGKSRELHANGVTYSKTTAPTSGESKNKLITQQKRSTCHCSSVVLNSAVIPTTTATGDVRIGKVPTAKTTAAGDAYQPLSKQVSADTNSPVKSAHGASDESFYYYEMGKIFFRPGDEQMAKDKIVNVKQQEPRDGLCTSDIASTISQPPTSDNCRRAVCAEAEDNSKCKVAGCHHPSSRLSNGGGSRISAKYNEDVRLQATVSRDNLILDSSHMLKKAESSPTDKSHVVLDDVSRVASTTNCSHKKLADGGNCRCCRMPTSQQQERQHNLHHSVALEQETNGRLRFGAGLGSKFLSQNRNSSTNTGYASPKSSPNGRPLCLTGATKLIAKSKMPNKPICRSNSELLPALEKGSSGTGDGRMVCPQNQSQKEQRLLFGKLRNSLLSQPSPDDNDALRKFSKLACSQASLNNYNSSNHLVSPIMAHGGNHLQKHELKIYNLHNHNGNHHHHHHHHHGSTTALDDHMNVDENFILKRKTPNAGLKSRC